MNEPLYKWSDKLLDLLYREIEEDYELHFTAREEESQIISLKAQNYIHCTRFVAYQPQINKSLQDRMLGLSRLIKENHITTLPPLTINATFIGNSKTLNEFKEDIDQLEIKNQFVSVSFSTLQRESVSSLRENDLPIYLMDRTSDNQMPEIAFTKYAFMCVLSDKTELLGIKNRICSYAFQREEFFDVIFRCFLLFPLAEAFSSYARALLQCIRQPDTQLRIRELLAEKPILNITTEREIELGTSVPLRITSSPVGFKTPELAFQYQPDGIVECTQQRITAIKAGDVVVFVFEKGEAEPSATLHLTVIKRNRIRVITLSDYSLLMGKGDSYTISMEFEPDDADNVSKIQWYSDNENIAKVDNGYVQTVGIGECTIWCAAEKVSTNCHVVCKPYLSDIILPAELQHEEVVLCLGEKIPLNIQCVPVDSIDGKLKISSSNLLVVTIENNCLVAGGLGTSVISIESSRGRIKKSIHMTVVKKKGKEKGSLISKLFGKRR